MPPNTTTPEDSRPAPAYTAQRPTGAFIDYSLCWVSLAIAVLLLTVGVWNATLAASEKGFYAMAFLLALFGAVAVQKNIRDVAQFNRAHPEEAGASAE